MPWRTLSWRRSRNGGIGLGSARGQHGQVPILRIVKRQMSLNAYDAAAAELDLDRRHPLGLIMHAATKAGDTVEIVQVWESAHYARYYDDEILRPALEAVNAP